MCELQLRCRRFLLLEIKEVISISAAQAAGSHGDEALLNILNEKYIHNFGMELLSNFSKG